MTSKRDGIDEMINAGFTGGECPFYHNNDLVQNGGHRKTEYWTADTAQKCNDLCHQHMKDKGYDEIQCEYNNSPEYKKKYASCYAHYVHRDGNRDKGNVYSSYKVTGFGFGCNDLKNNTR